MRAKGITRIACPSHQLPPLNRKTVRGQHCIKGKSLVLILMFAHKGSHFGKETLQMSVYGGITIIVRNIEGITISTRCHTDARDIPIGRTIQRFPFHTLCLEVKPSMKMVAPKFGKISTQKQREVEGDTENPLLPKHIKGKKEKEKKPHPNPPQRRGNRRCLLLNFPPFGGQRKAMLNMP